jgi:hypothetical protein
MITMIRSSAERLKIAKPLSLLYQLGKETGKGARRKRFPVSCSEDASVAGTAHGGEYDGNMGENDREGIDTPDIAAYFDNSQLLFVAFVVSEVCLLVLGADTGRLLLPDCGHRIHVGRKRTLQGMVCKIERKTCLESDGNRIFFTLLLAILRDEHFIAE